MKTIISFVFILSLTYAQHSIAQMRSNSVNEVTKICESAFAVKKSKKLKRFCNNYQVRNIFNDLQVINGKYNFSSTHDAFFQCITDLSARADYQDKNSPITCSDFNFRASLRSGDLNSCMTNVPKVLNINDSWSLCSNFRSRGLVLRSSYIACIEKTIDMGLSDRNAIRRCEETNFRAKLKAHDVVSCIKKFPQADMFNFEEKINVCGDYQAKNKLQSKEVSQCIPLLKNMGLNSHLLGVCVERGRDIMGSNQKELRSCIDKGLNAAYGSYFDLETQVLNKNFNHNKNSYYYLIEDCLDRNEYKNENEYFSYLQDINIHSNEAFQTKEGQSQMYGLSAVRYDKEKKSLVILSDSRHTPKLFQFKLKQQKNKSFSIIPETTLSLKAPKGKQDYFSALDPEGLILMSNGDLVISSEQKTDKKKLELILRYNSEGDLIDTIDVPEDFEQKSETIKEDHKDTFYYVEDNISFNKTTGKRQVGSSYRSTQKPWNCKRPRCDYKKKTEKYTTTRVINNQGMSYNKGLESLGMTEDEQYIFTANESSLIQDKDNSYKFNRREESVRIVRYDNSSNKPVANGQFLYLLEDEEDNGLVDILPISDTKILTLERSYNQFKKKITARIFLTDLANATDVAGVRNIHESKGNIQEANKTQLIDLDDILPAMSPGFKKLDNFEGMSFGPTLEDGSKTLVLVSDNNNSLSQRTIVLMLKVKKPL